MEILIFILAFLVGYVILHFVSNDNLIIRKKMPKLKTGPVQFCPNIRLIFENRVIHFHHWFNFSILLFISIFFISGGVLDALFTKGFLVGGILQGLSMRETRMLIYKPGLLPDDK